MASPTAVLSPNPRRHPQEVGKQYLVARADGVLHPAIVLDTRVTKLGKHEAYISFIGQDKRLDQWVQASSLGDEVPVAGPSGTTSSGADDKRLKVPETPRPAEQTDVSTPSTPEREHAAVTRVRNFEDVRFGEYLIKTWYYSPYPMPLDESQSNPLASPHLVNPPTRTKGRKRKEPPTIEDGRLDKDKAHQSLSRTTSEVLAVGVGKGGEGARGRLWACDLCFKYMRTRAGWESHTTSCTQLLPPGRRVYQRGSYTIWEIDGAESTLYCQNLSLFGKLFIDHKSVFFHVENFFFYVLCDASTSKRDQVMAFFSKEKFSYDDYNLACIVTFPPFQNRGFGKLLIEFSYYLTKHPSTAPPSSSPGTPERPLSDLGYKGYMAYWVSVVLRLLRRLLADAPAPGETGPIPKPSPTPSPKKPEGRILRRRKSIVRSGDVHVDKVVIDGIELEKRSEQVLSLGKGHYSITLPLSTMARLAHIKIDDLVATLTELGFLDHRRTVAPPPSAARRGATRSASRVVPSSGLDGGHEPISSPHVNGWEDSVSAAGNMETAHTDNSGLLGPSGPAAGHDWAGVEVVITQQAVNDAWTKWRVKDRGVLDEAYVLL